MQKKMDGMSSGLDLNAPSFTTQPKDIDARWTDLLNKPRVMKGKDLPKSPHEGFQVRYPDWTQVGLETFICFFEEFPPGGVSQRHGHMNEAVFYILEGRGYEIHDGEKFPWEAGDLVIIPDGSVHRHVNADPNNPAMALVINPKPTFISYNLRAQRLVDRPGEGST
ncbi:MAG: cupin domain-containing protein [Chloroflexi bacterium]|nr:cupin domain-containing protein [Chloroflexota bacterium]